jgi:hypothetical protein
MIAPAINGDASYPLDAFSFGIASNNNDIRQKGLKL